MKISTRSTHKNYSFTRTIESSCIMWLKNYPSYSLQDQSNFKDGVIEESAEFNSI